MNGDGRIVTKLIAASPLNRRLFRQTTTRIANDQRATHPGLARCLDALADVGCDEDLDGYTSELEAAEGIELARAAAVLGSMSRLHKSKNAELAGLFEAALRLTCNVRDRRSGTGGAA